MTNIHKIEDGRLIINMKEYTIVIDKVYPYGRGNSWQTEHPKT